MKEIIKIVLSAVARPRCLTEGERLFDLFSSQLYEDFLRQIEDNEHLWTFDKTNLHRDRN